jgi:hypothetical protein
MEQQVALENTQMRAYLTTPSSPQLTFCDIGDSFVSVHCVSKNAGSKYNLANIQGDVVYVKYSRIHAMD